MPSILVAACVLLPGWDPERFVSNGTLAGIKSVLVYAERPPGSTLDPHDIKTHVEGRLRKEGIDAVESSHGVLWVSGTVLAGKKTDDSPADWSTLSVNLELIEWAG
ncbi:MAG: hypothetical protein O7D94_09205, partial [Planctomycetota bacterium]|nr:hypothetical protein [Planctomycetota bacterium]